ncbi:serine/threonine-protein kinase ATR-like [Penaeus monodon]|uniref:serine/threonine-protein kinase ATR-like n=1 Tax=Penaeus monodon TaxID=6687 RepID=UPI0018A71CEA|nr:serine/threonine-protein kinase ATR-like [Penaeus monodon]
MLNVDHINMAHLIIHSLANTLGLPLKDLYIRHRQSLAQVLSEIVKQGEVGAMLSHVAEVFEWNISSTGSSRNQGKSSVGQFIISQIRHLLPALAVRATQEAKPGLLQELAGCLSLRLRDILIDHFQHILAYLVFHYPQEEQEAVLDFIASTTDIHIQNIRRCSVQNQVNELILGLHDHRDAVLREFSRMRAIEQSNIAEYLAPRLLGILGFLDSKLVSSSTMYKDDEFFDIGCSAWDKLPVQHLGGLLEEVAVVVKPLVKERPQQMAPVLTNVLVEMPSIRPLLGICLSFLKTLPLHRSIKPS